MKIFVISHPNFSERYNYIRKPLDDRTKRSYDIVGIDGRELDLQRENSGAGHTTQLRPGQVGCTLGHCQAYEHLIKSNSRFAFIIEDDTVLPKNIDLILDKISLYVRPGEVISLQNRTISKIQLSRGYSQRIMGMALLYPMTPRSVRGASAYVITRDAAQNILSYNLPVKYGADSWGIFYEKGLVRSYRVLHPSPFRWMPFAGTTGRKRPEQSGLLKHLIRARRRYILRKNINNVELVDAYSPLAVENGRA